MKKPSTARMIVAGSADAADLRYACGFSPVDPVVFLDARPRAKHLVVPLLEYGRAQDEARDSRVWNPEQLDVPILERRSPAAWAVALARRTRTRAVRVSASFPLGVARALERAKIRVDVAEGALYPERAVKSAREIEFLRAAQRGASAAMRVALRALRDARINRAGELIDGARVLTSEKLKALIDRALLERQCIARETIVACGAHAADPHHRGEGPLRAGETIVIDIFPQHQPSGYWGDITRTVVKGSASPTVRRMYRAVRAAQRWARDAIRPGVRADRIHEEIKRRFDAAGFAAGSRDGRPVGFFHGTGHGVGLEIHEAPAISTAKIRLRAGHVVTVEPGLYDPAHGGVRIEDTVLVTPAGAQALVPFPYPFELP
jgi:Xaa-Pro aminopeptidase